MNKVFIVGSHGTTGLRLKDRLNNRDDIELLQVDFEMRHDVNIQKDIISECDVIFLCLPDDPAREYANLANDFNIKIIDTSTAHRTSKKWDYGFPELSQEHKKSIIDSNNVAVPGCHATGFISLIKPLIDNKIVSKDYPFSFHSITGYSGGGKSMISEYEDENRDKEFSYPRQYALSQNHKHLAEIEYICGLNTSPIFTPVVQDFYSGMLVSIPLHKHLLNKKVRLQDIHKILSERYDNSNIIKVMPICNDGFLNCGCLSGRDDMQIYVTGNDDRIVLLAHYDNLGKGASGAAIQCFNLMINTEETKGLLIN